MSQFGLPDSNGNVLEEGNKLTSILNWKRKRVSSMHKRTLDG